MKDICLNVILYIIVAILLIYSAVGYWKGNRKTVAVLTIVVVVLTLWQAAENVREIQMKNT